MATKPIAGRRIARRAASLLATLVALLLSLVAADAGQAGTMAGTARARAAGAHLGSGRPLLAISGPTERRPSAASATSATGTRDGAPSAPPDHGAIQSGVQVTAHDGSFWQGKTQITLHGTNLTADRGGLNGFIAQAQQAASWGMNLVRLGVQWSDVEPTAPVHNSDGSWTHTFDTAAMDRIEAAVDAVTSLGMVVEVNSNADGSFWGYPAWQFKAPYNSHHITYPETDDGLVQASTDFWTDSRRQEFMTDWLKYLVTHLKSHSGVMGYGILNEPRTGSLPDRLSTAQQILDWQLTAARIVRATDPNRIIVFATYHGYAPGLWRVDLSDWINADSLPQPLGFPDVAVEAHDYFGGRWGTGLVVDPGDPRDQMGYEDLYALVLGDFPSTYIGTTQGQMQWVRDKQQALAKWKIPLLVDEFGDNEDDPGVTLFFGTTTSAFAATGVSWALSRGKLGIVDKNGNLQPYAQIVINAARNYP